MFKKIKKKLKSIINYYGLKYGINNPEYERNHYYFDSNWKPFPMPNMYFFYAWKVFLYRTVRWYNKFTGPIFRIQYKLMVWLKKKSINYYIKKYNLYTLKDYYDKISEFQKEEIFVDKDGNLVDKNGNLIED